LKGIFVFSLAKKPIPLTPLQIRLSAYVNELDGRQGLLRKIVSSDDLTDLDDRISHTSLEIVKLNSLSSFPTTTISIITKCLPATLSKSLDVLFRPLLVVQQLLNRTPLLTLLLSPDKKILGISTPKIPLGSNASEFTLFSSLRSCERERARNDELRN